MSDTIRAARKRLIDSELYDVKVYEEGGGPIGQGHSQTADLITVADIWPDDFEKYTPEWARTQFGDMPTFTWSGPNGQKASLTILWAKEDAWLTGSGEEGSVAIPLPTKGAARRLVAAIRECCEGETQ